MPVWNPTANEIFLAALDIEGPDARQAHLDAACGNDADLRKQVEALLQAHAAASSFLEDPVDLPAPGPVGARLDVLELVTRAAVSFKAEA